jgi:hypothetical protein
MSVGTLRDRLEATDPGHIRLNLALRTTAGMAVTFAVLTGLRFAFNWSAAVPLFGAVLAMSWSMTVNDPTPAERRHTTLLLWLPTALTATLGGLTEGSRLASELVFLAILFAAFYVRGWGPRWIAFGFLGTFAFFLTWFLQTRLADLPGLLTALAVTMATTYAFRFVVFADRPESALRHALAALRARIRLIATAVETAHHAGDWTPALRRHVERDLLLLNYTALVVDDILRDAVDPQMRAAVLETEIAAESLAETALADPRSPEIAGQLRETADDVHDLLQQAEGVTFAEGHWAPRPGFRPRVDAGRVPENLRQAVQVTVAAAVAIGVGEAISSARWYWAVLAAFIVFAGTVSVGETLNRAWGRTGGTVVGILAGIAVVRLVRGNEALELLLMFAFLFAAVYVFRISYVGMVFCITGALSLMYGVLGLFSDELMFLRLGETMAGAVVGAAASAFVLPLRTAHVSGSITAEVLQRLRAVVDVSVDALLGRGHDDPTATMRAFDETLQTVRVQLRATASYGLRGRLPRTRLQAIAACGTYARNLTAAAESGTPPRSPAELEASRAALDARIDDLLMAVRDDRPPPERPSVPRPTSGDPAALALYRLDRALRHLARIIARA